MTMIRWFRAVVSPRGAPAIRRAVARHPVVFLALVLFAVGQTGCQSGPLGGCGKCGLGNRVRGMSERSFRPFKHCKKGAAGGCTTCGGGSGGTEIGVEAPPVQYGTPAVVGPATIGPGSSLPGPSESFPSGTGIEPIPSETRPSANPGPPAGATESTPSQGARSSTGKANYEAYRPKPRGSQRRAGALARSLDASPEPTPRSAQGSSPSSADLNPLDNLPPLDIPRDVTRGDSPPVPPAADREGRQVAGPAPVQEAESLADVAARAAAKPPGEVNVSPGIRRMAGVETKLAGGSLPDRTGLDWLAERGYRTILDLRESGDLSPAFIADVARRGMRYIALPITVKTVDAEHVSRFNFELSLSDARPLYFCDTDGTRAGVMWYVRRVTVDKVDPQVARRDAEELGLSDPQFWLAANAYIDGLKSAAAPAPAPAAASPPADDANAAPAPSAAVEPRASDADDARKAGVVVYGSPRDSDVWRPLAALAVTGLGLPLAYLGRSSLLWNVSAKARASLPGPRRSLRSLPGRSDV